VQSTRSEYLEFARAVFSGRGPWLLEKSEGFKFWAARRVRNIYPPALSGFFVVVPDLHARREPPIAEPFIAIRVGRSWLVSYSTWNLYRLSRGASFGEEDILSVLKDPNLARPAALALAEKPTTAPVKSRDLASAMESTLSEAPRSGYGRPRTLEEVSSAVEETLSLGLLGRTDCAFGHEFSVMLGAWESESFRREYSIPLEFFRLLEIEVMHEIETFGEVPRVEELSLTARMSASSRLGRLSVGYDVLFDLGWLYHVLDSASRGGVTVRAVYHSLGSIALSEMRSHPFSLLSPEEWSSVAREAMRRIVDRKLLEAREKIEREPSLSSKSRFLRTLIRDVERRLEGVARRGFGGFFST